MSEQDPSQIEELKKSLYSRNAPLVRTKRRLHFEKPDTEGIQTDWEHPPENDEDTVLNKRYEDHSMSFLTKLFIASTVFFVLAVGIGAYLVFNGSNIVSTNNIDITVSGPVSVSGGTPVTFDVQVINKNNIKLENVDFVVDFPSGTVDPADDTKELKQFRELMNDIEAGGVAQKTVQAIVYGQENSKKTIIITTSYKVKGSNAIFQKQKSFDILLSSSPLSLSVESFKEITSGQTFDTKITLISNSQETLKNITLKAIYPFGFTYLSSDVKTSGNNSSWRIGDIPPGGKRSIVVNGKLEGQDDETRAFRFIVGSESGQGSQIPVIGTEFISHIQELTIKKPFITVGIALEDSMGVKEFIGEFNESIKTDISWFNNLPTAITDGEVYIKLSGNAFDKFSVSPGQGLYQSADNTIVWNRITTPNLGNVGAGEEGKVTFNLTPRDTSTTFKTVANPTVSLVVDVRGKRVSESNVPEQLISSATRVIKISSNPSVSAQIIRTGSSFTNIGPVPPRAEQETTYTIVWTVDNTSSTLSGVEVKSSLPAYVTWRGQASPTDESIVYDKGTGEITWKVGSVDTYTINNKRRRQVAFQVAFKPSVAQIGQTPVIMGQSTLTAHDDFTEQNLARTQEALNTRFSTDSTFRDGDEVVRQ